MADHFKAKKIWRSGIEALADAEAGRLMKALWKYADTGEKPALVGGEKLIFAMIAAEIEKEGAE